MSVDLVREGVKNGRPLLFELESEKIKVQGNTPIEEINKKMNKNLTVQDILSATWYLT